MNLGQLKAQLAQAEGEGATNDTEVLWQDGGEYQQVWYVDFDYRDDDGEDERDADERDADDRRVITLSDD